MREGARACVRDIVQVGEDARLFKGVHEKYNMCQGECMGYASGQYGEVGETYPSDF